MSPYPGEPTRRRPLASSAPTRIGSVGHLVQLPGPSFEDGRRAGRLMPNSVGREVVQELVANGAQLVEVLPRGEYEEEHLRGAINIPLKELDALGTSHLDRARPVIVYCFDFL